MENCIFCRIIAGEIPSKKAYEDDLVLALHDIAPQAPVHVLIVPKEHIPCAGELTQGHGALLGRMFEVAAKLTEEFELNERGYRLVINAGEDGGQTVDHLHMHLIGGRSLAWPPG